MASRNRTEMSAQLFNKLIVKSAEGDIAINEGGRWIKKLNDYDTALMSKSNCEPLILSRQSKAMLISYDGNRFFVTSGFPVCEEPFDALEQIDATPALFVISVLELGLQPQATAIQIMDVIHEQSNNIEGYNGHALDDIVGLFSRLSYYKVSNDVAIADNIVRLTGSYASRSCKSGPLLLQKSTKDRVANLFEGGNDFIPFSLILQGVMSFSWQTFFLELYRCLEQLYSAPRIQELSKELSLKNSLYDIAMTLERLLAWRPREEESLTRILRYCSAEHVNSVTIALQCEKCEGYEQATEVAARAIYKLRNSSVHFRPSNEFNNLGDDNWNILVLSMLDLISEAYDKIGHAFHMPSILEAEI